MPRCRPWNRQSSDPTAVGPAVMGDVTAPLFVFGDDLDVFDSLDALAQYVEPIDVIQGDLRAYDSKGRRVAVRAEGVHTGRFTVGGGRTIAELSQPPVDEPEALASALRGYVASVGPHRFGVTEEWPSRPRSVSWSTESSNFMVLAGGERQT